MDTPTNNTKFSKLLAEAIGEEELIEELIHEMSGEIGHRKGRNWT